MDDGLETTTSVSQRETEVAVSELLAASLGISRSRAVQRAHHVEYLRKSLLESISTSYQVLDASRVWLCYWIVHALDLLGERLPSKDADRVIDFLARCQSPTGGFGGGPQQLAHLAPTYAAVNTLVILGKRAALEVINRKTLYQWLLTVRRPDGSFIMHHDGEVDLRSCYCALSVASICNIVTPELARGTAEWIASCQTYEGGLGGVPGVEAHGGYTFCGFAAMHILGKTSLLNMPRLLHWAANRQMRLEGGFQGRTNKLVDSCYSFWMGGIFPLLAPWIESQTIADAAVNDDGNNADTDAFVDVPEDDLYMFDREALQRYILHCCEMPGGGFRDKPGKNRDYYHTCYALSGLSLAQHLMTLSTGYASSESSSFRSVHGAPANLLIANDPVHNVATDRLADALTFFSQQPSVV